MRNDIHIRPYHKQDKAQVLRLLRLNTPQYFAPEEESELDYYLDYETELYYVIEFEGIVIGSGGINFAENKTIGKISWDLLHPEYQGKSLGTQLLKYRIEKLQAIASIQKITVRTSQVAYKFYEKKGFNLIEVIKDYWAKGFHMYHMEYIQLK